MAGLSPQDKADIREVMARYCWHVDHAPWDEWLSLFADDGSWGAAGARPFEGREALQKLASGLARKRATGVPGRHVLGEPWIENSEDGARLRSYVAVVTGAGVARSVGEFDVRLVRLADGWKIRSLRFEPLEQESQTAAPAGVAS